MKHNEKEINDVIRRKLRSSFENFERLPDAGIDDKIHKELHKKPFGRGAYLISSLMGIMIFVGIGFWSSPIFQSDELNLFPANSKVLNPGTSDNHVRGKNEKALIKENTEKESPKPAYQIGIDKQFEGRDLGKKLVINEKPFNNQLEPAVQNHFHSPPQDESVVPQAVQKNEYHVEQLAKAHNDVPLTALVPAKELKLVEAREPKDEWGEDQPEAISKTTSPEPNGEKTTDSRKIEFTEIENMDPSEMALALLAHNSSLVTGQKMTLPEIKYQEVENTDSAAMAKPKNRFHSRLYIDWSEMKKVSLVVNAIPIQTIQRVNVSAKAGSRIQDITFPGIFSTWGYKFGVGLEKQGFQFLVNFSRIDNQISYEYASDEFKVVETASNGYKIKRLGTAASFSGPVNLLGLGAKKQIDFNSRLAGKFYTNLGLEYSTSFGASSERFLFANLSSGKVFRLNSYTSLSVGPYFEYSFRKITAADGQIWIRPSQVGVSVGLKLSRPK